MSLFTAAWLCAGCATLSERDLGNTCPRLYAGTKTDTAVFDGVGTCSPAPLIFLGGVLDLPFSFIADSIVFLHRLRKNSMNPACYVETRAVYYPKCRIEKGTLLERGMFREMQYPRMSLRGGEIKSFEELEGKRAGESLSDLEPARESQIVARPEDQ